MKELWKITISLFNMNEPSTSTEWGWKFENDTLYLNFQGSSTFRDSTGKLAEDWKQNFDFLKTPYKSMPKRFRVHRGFLAKWKSVRDEVVRVVYNHAHKRIVVCGFSQGAALATLCHEELVFRGFDPVTWAFGSPRVFSWSAPKERFINLHYVQYGGDMVTGVPFWFLGYKHVSNKRIQLKKWPTFFRIGFWQHMKYFEYFKED